MRMALAGLCDETEGFPERLASGGASHGHGTTQRASAGKQLFG